MFGLKVCVTLLALCAVLTAATRRDVRRPERRPERRDPRQPRPSVREEPATALPAPVHLYPFGNKDNIFKDDDDGNSGSVKIPSFTFFGRKYNRLYVNTNGLISFKRPIGTYTPNWFPQRSDVLIAPYWADADTNANDGEVHYRMVTNNPTCLGRVSEFVQKSFKNSFNADWVFIATWYRVTFYGGSHATPVNTFQAVLTANRRESYVIFNYGDIAWTTGKASEGDDNGLGGYPAEVGFNAGDGWRHYTQFGSLTPDIIDIRTKTNCNLRGRLLFRVDGREILSPEPSMYGCFKALTTLARSALRGSPKGGD